MEHNSWANWEVLLNMAQHKLRHCSKKNYMGYLAAFQLTVQIRCNAIQRVWQRIDLNHAKNLLQLQQIQKHHYWYTNWQTVQCICWYISWICSGILSCCSISKKFAQIGWRIQKKKKLEKKRIRCYESSWDKWWHPLFKQVLDFVYVQF